MSHPLHDSTVSHRPFAQVDVFSSEPFRGNPLAVVLDAQGLSTEQMQQFANWTNLSETTFLFPPNHPEADYRVRIFTGHEEFPFAGHPTLGSAHAWLAAGGRPRIENVVVQECAAGLIRVREEGSRLAFAAPPMTRTGPVDKPLMQQIMAALGLERTAVRDASWLVNGPSWIGLLLDSADRVLSLNPNFEALGELKVGVIGPYLHGGQADYEVRTFIPGDAAPEDPITGSFNAGAAQWLIGGGRAPDSYVAAQGTVLGRAGRVFVQREGDETWIGGDVASRVTGTVSL